MNSTCKIRLYKILKERGNYTKSQIINLIKENRVLVNDEIKPLSYIINQFDIVTVDNQILQKVPYVYYLYHKPVGIVCSNNQSVKNNIFDHLKLPIRVFCVGRLDKDTSGLIILTNDGQFANQIINSQSNIEKEYIVEVKYLITDEFIKNLEKPIVLRNKISKGAKVKKIDDYHFDIIILEGMYHQIRRLVIYNHNQVTKLKRIRIGKYQLNNLKEDELIIIGEKNETI